MTPQLFLPVVTYPDVTDEDTLRGAIAVSATLGARLTACIAEVDIPPVGNVVAEVLARVSELSREVEQRSARAAEAAAVMLRTLAEKAGVELEVRHERWRLDVLMDRLTDQSRVGDLSLLSPSAAQGVADAGEAVLFGSGGPVLLLPPSGATLSLATVAIAWDGSRSAARAVRDVIAYLRPETRAIVLTQGSDKQIDPTSVARLLGYLAARGIDARQADVPVGDRSVGHDLQSAALGYDAGLLVMGAYGHSRVREFVLGGATREVLAATELAVFMSH